jgi:acyl-CoA synthetase (AMP-forming)/AMP-acid ligase II
MELYNYSIYNVIRRNAALQGSRLSLRSADRRIGHGELLDLVDRLARGLVRAGVKKGDRLAILSNNSPEYVFVLGAAARIGALAVPINWRLKHEEIENILSDATPRALFVDAENLPLAMPLAAMCGSIERRYVIGEAGVGFDALASLLSGPGGPPDAGPGLEDPYVVIYTAAVQGKPRGAVLSHRNILFSSLQYICSLGLTHADIHVGTLPLFHIAGLGLLFATMHAGGANLLMPKFDADLALEYIEKDKATVFAEFPPILKTVLEKADGRRSALGSLRHVVGLDLPDTVKRLEEATGATFWTGYGQSETTGFVSFSPYFEKEGSAGVANLESEIRIMGENGTPRRPGETGEIAVRGPLVFSGYWNRDGDNRHTFRGGWHHTGDMGRIDEDGYLWYVGRSSEKELIKPGGENVYPAEVEKAILEHPRIAQAAVFGVPDPEWGEAIKAVCVLSAGSMEATELIEFVAARIARYKKPKHVVFVTDLPKKGDGTVDREKVKALYG